MPRVCDHLSCSMSQQQQVCRQKICESRVHFFICECTSAYVWPGAQRDILQGPTWHRVISKPVAGKPVAGKPVVRRQRGAWMSWVARTTPVAARTAPRALHEPLGLRHGSPCGSLCICCALVPKSPPKSGSPKWLRGLLFTTPSDVMPPCSENERSSCELRRELFVCMYSKVQSSVASRLAHSAVSAVRGVCASCGAWGWAQ